MTESLLRDKNKWYADSSRLRRLLESDKIEHKNMQNTSVIEKDKEGLLKISSDSDEIVILNETENGTAEVEKFQLERDMAEIHGENHTEGKETNEATSKGDSELLKQLEDASDDDSDDGKLHIAEEPAECQKTKVENDDDDIKVLYDNGCPFDCCTKGLTNKLYQISDRINHEIFKRTREIENGILLKARHPELVAPTDFENYWRSVQNAGDEEIIIVNEAKENENEDKMDNFDENSLHFYYPNVEIHCDEEKSLKKDSTTRETDSEVEKEQIENNIPIPVLQIREEKSTEIIRKEVVQKPINYLNAVSCIATEEEECRVIKRSSSVFPIDTVQLPPKKRGHIYRPWSEHIILPKNHCVEIQQITNKLHSGVSDQDRPMVEQVVDLSQIQAKHANNAISTNHDFINSETTDKNSKYSNWQKSPSQFSSLLEKYSHITSLENGNRIYMCKMCYTTLKSEDEIKAHLYCQGVTKRVHCYLCRQDFTKESYRQHLEHHDAHPAALKCKPCGIVFDNFAAKSEHQKSYHRGENMRDRESGNGAKEFPYILCYLCGREFRTAKAATSHFLSHINGYPFPCNFCNHWFKGIETAVTRFVLRHNGGNTFMCGIDPMLYTGILHGNSTA